MSMELGHVRLFLLCVFVIGRSAPYDEKTLPQLTDNERIGEEKGAIHVVTTTECNGRYFDFQSLALKSTFDKVYRSGSITRIVSCDREDVPNEEGMEAMDTLVVPNWKVHPVTHDIYSPYNRPVGLMFWLSQREPTAEWTLIVDPDMLFRQPLQVDLTAIPDNVAMSSGYHYLKGVYNELADRHIGFVEPRDDTNGGPKGRRADQAGSFFLVRTRDLLKIAPLWLKYTEDVRDDPNAWNLTGDQYVQPGGRAWISEMYGYAFAAAVSGVWHLIDSTMQYYPGYFPKDIPFLTHYGLNMKLGNYSFDKHDHNGFQSFVCPPWNLDPKRKKEDDKGLFPHPPYPDQIVSNDPRERYGQLMIIETVTALNQALCERHRRKCPESDQLTTECAKVDDIAASVEKEFDKLHKANLICYDNDERCALWADQGECRKNWRYMDGNCRTACHRCRQFIPLNKIQRANEVEIKNRERHDDDMPYDIEVELIRCAHMSRKELNKDVHCSWLIAAGYADLEVLMESSPTFASDFTEYTSNKYFAWTYLTLLFFVILAIGSTVGRRLLCRAKPLKVS